MEIRIEGVSAMAHGETRTFDFIREGRPAQGFLIRYHGEFHAYRNKCQHWPVPIDLGDGDFFHAGADRIMCKTHGAVYRPDTGICDYGPCVNARLEAYSAIPDGDNLLVLVPD